MRHLILPVCLCLLAGCASDPGKSSEARPLTGAPKLDRCLAKLQVTSCSVSGLPTSKPGAPVKARASLKVDGKDASSDPHHARVSVYDPAAGELKEADGSGNLLVPVGGAIVAVAGSGGALVWWMHEKGKGSGEVDLAGEGGTPVSVATKRAANPGSVKVTAKTARGMVDCTPVASTDEAVCANAPLTAADAGNVTLTAIDAGEVIGSEDVLLVMNSIQFVPQTINPGQTGQLVGEFLPAGRQITVAITLTGTDTAPQMLVQGQIAGEPGNYTITFTGKSEQLSTALFSVVGTQKEVQASADVVGVK